MSQQLDLSLPARAPSMARYHDQPMTLHPAALYTLVDLTDAEFQELQDECEAECLETGHERGTSVRPAPQSRFVGQPLRAAFDYHVDLGTQDTYEPRYFIAAVEKDWRVKGVILVTLDDDDLECKVDKFRVKAVDSGLSIVNLQIGNTSWDEEKEGYEFQPGNDDDDGDNNNNDSGDDGDGGDGPPAPDKNIPLGYYIPIYMHSNLSEDQVVANLEPGFKQKEPENFACRVQAKLTPGMSASEMTPAQELIKQAAALHPQRCAKNKYLHKNHIIVIDTENPSENGMLMVKLPSWDEDHFGTEKPDLHEAGKQLAQVTLQHIRTPYSCHDGLQTRFLTLANGDAEWPSEDVRTQPVFVVFQYNTQSKELGFGAKSIDPEANKRNPGEERVVCVPSLIKWPGHGLEKITWNYDEAIRRFPWFCREKRFVEGLDKTFFACVDGNDVAQTGLLLVRRNWDGNVWNRTREELLDLPIEGVKSVRVPIKEALKILEKGRQGQTDGMSES
jgi:hypothetical protein